MDLTRLHTQTERQDGSYDPPPPETLKRLWNSNISTLKPKPFDDIYPYKQKQHLKYTNNKGKDTLCSQKTLRELLLLR